MFPDKDNIKEVKIVTLLHKQNITHESAQSYSYACSLNIAKNILPYLEQAVQEPLQEDLLEGTLYILPVIGGIEGLMRAITP